MNHSHTVIYVGNWTFWIEAQKAWDEKRDYTFRLLADGGIVFYNIGEYSGDTLDFMIAEANHELAKAFHNAVFEQTVLHEKEVEETTERKTKKGQARITFDRSSSEET